MHFHQFHQEKRYEYDFIKKKKKFKSVINIYKCFSIVLLIDLIIINMIRKYICPLLLTKVKNKIKINKLIILIKFDFN